MSWLDVVKTAAATALSTMHFAARLLYMLSTPLRWPLYYIYATVVFLLSPIWFIASIGLRATFFALDFVASLKYLYIYLACAIIIGACTGLVLHSTSSFIVVLLGWDAASERRTRSHQQYLELMHPYPASSFAEDDDDKKEYDDGSSSRARWQRSDRKRSSAELDPNDLFEKQWKLVRTPVQPRRQGKGLLGQTIHEESSESDLS